MLSNSDGKKLVKLTRKTIEDYFKNKEIKLKETKFKEKRGVFVSIHTSPDHELRGCIGYPYPILQLGEALQKASISAAFQDPRFPPLIKNELKKVVFEVSVLSVPTIIKIKDPKDYLKKISIGKDGLIIKNEFFQGLLLPQVPKKYNWNVETFLEHLCMKAGLMLDMWLDPKTKIYKFQTQVFIEKEPNGEIIQT
jgi:uncharacterized protein (TIGR00296 family)